MRRFLMALFMSLSTCCALLAVSSPASGNEPRKGVDVDVSHNGVRVDVGAKSNSGNASAAGVVRGSDLLSLSVYGENHEKLGDIKDFVIDPAKGKIRYAVLSFDSFLGMGGKYFAVPWTDIRFISKGKSENGTLKESYCVIGIEKQDLKMLRDSIKTSGRISPTTIGFPTSKNTIKNTARPASRAARCGSHAGENSCG